MRRASPDRDTRCVAQENPASVTDLIERGRDREAVELAIRTGSRRVRRSDDGGAADAEDATPPE